MLKWLVPPLTVLLLLFAGDAAHPDAHAGSSIAWRDCDGGLECATIAVPLDHDAPGGETIDLAFARRRAADADARIGALLINPGGPGASGVAFLRTFGDNLPAAWHDNFDTIGFDPRGTGGTAPLDCTDDPTAMTDLDPSPDDEDERDELYGAARGLAQACAQAYGENLAFIDTVSTAKDIELLRIALGEDTLSYFGYSYGTLLGATFAGLYPDRVRAFVLDGAIDPALSPEEIVIGQARGFESGLNAFFADCAADPDCAFTPDPGRNLGQTFDAILERIDAEPLPTDDDDGRLTTVGVALVGVQAAMYDESLYWPLLRIALGEANEGDGSGLLRLADTYNGRSDDGYSDLLEAYFAITCIDQPFPVGLTGYTSLLPRLMEAAPRMWASTTVGTNLPCAFWPVPAKGAPGPIRAEGAAPIVVVGTTNDTATPYAWAQGLASQLTSGVLLTHVGEGHTAYRQGSACIDNALDTYLVTLVPPPDGTICQEDGVTSTPVIPTPPAQVPSPEPTRSGGIAAPETGTPANGGPSLWAWFAGAGAIVAIAAAAWALWRYRQGA
jgi:pimeloyl-ACP methyl ester carboxylesterase